MINDVIETRNDVIGTIEIFEKSLLYYSDVIMSVMASQITSLTVVYSTIYSGADQRKHQSSASLAFVWWIHRWPVNSPHKWPVTRKCFHLMTSSLTRHSVTCLPSSLSCETYTSTAMVELGYFISMRPAQQELTNWPLGDLHEISRYVIFMAMFVKDGWWEIAFRWMPLDLTDNKSKLV